MCGLPDYYHISVHKKNLILGVQTCIWWNVQSFRNFFVPLKSWANQTGSLHPEKERKKERKKASMMIVEHNYKHFARN
jgi:hypothetical protein